MAGRETQCHETAHRMADDRGGLDIEVVQELANLRDIGAKRRIFRGRSTAAMAKHVDGNDAIRSGKGFDLRMPGIGIETDAVNEDERLTRSRRHIGCAA